LYHAVCKTENKSENKFAIKLHEKKFLDCMQIAQTPIYVFIL